MNFTKNKRMSLIAVFTLLVVYNVVAFVIPFDRHGGFWTGYSFSMLAILITAAGAFYALGQEGMKSKFYGLPLVSVVWIYLTTQLVAGFIQMSIPEIPFRYGIVVNVLLLGACLIGLITVNISKEEIERLDDKVKEKVFYIKSLLADVEGLEARASDESNKKDLKELVETIRYSDPMSSPQLASIENEIEVKVTALVDSGADVGVTRAICNELQQLFAQRNRKCRLLK
ncbi:MAG TPA: hypothetical protein VFD33_02335 [Bacillota bacterium]|nr:hypothetical protein [Bacillota bacterium]